MKNKKSVNEILIDEAQVQIVALAPEENQKIAVFTKNWIESTLLAHGMPNRCLKSWKKLQVVFGKEDVERLIELKAPIRVFIEHGSN